MPGAPCCTFFGRAGRWVTTRCVRSPALLGEDVITGALTWAPVLLPR